MEITNRILLERVQHLELNQYAENTIENYFTDVKLFFEFIKHEMSVNTVRTDDITMVIIDKWKKVLSETLTPKTSIYYKDKPTLSLQTIQSKLVAIKSLLKYLNNYHDCGLNYKKIETKRVKSDYVNCITDEERNLFFNFIWDFEKYRINSLRMQLLCNIGYTSWLRLSEALALTVDEIKEKECRITWKWNKTRRVFFTNSTENLLEEYLEERAKPIPRTWRVERQSDFVFISHNSGYDYGKPIAKNTACEIIKKYSDELDIWKRITMHSLRHSYATKLLENWLNIREIQELLWHKDIQTTEGYCHVLKSGLKSKVNQIFN